MNRSDLQKLARQRVRESRILLNAAEYAGSYYLIGYAVECALKACIAKQTRRFDFPAKQRVMDSHTHKLGDLLRLSGHATQHAADVNADPTFARRWAVVKDWNESSRYYTSVAPAVARDMYSAVTARQSGVSQWITRRW
jgi:hypothetical protein